MSFVEASDVVRTCATQSNIQTCGTEYVGTCGTEYADMWDAVEYTSLQRAGKEVVIACIE